MSNNPDHLTTAVGATAVALDSSANEAFKNGNVVTAIGKELAASYVALDHQLTHPIDAIRGTAQVNIDQAGQVLKMTKGR